MAALRGWTAVYLGIIGVVLIAHFPAWTGLASCNPMFEYAGLAARPLHHLLPGGCVIDANDGITLQALGGRAANMWLHGELPWWNSFAGLGLPLEAEAQPAAFFLPFVLLLHFYAGITLLKMTLQILAGAATVALLRELGLGRLAAFLGGACFALNGAYAWYSHSPILPVAFLPLLLFGLERCRTRAETNRAGGPLWVALGLGYSLLAGFPETAFMDGLLAGLWAFTTLARTQAAARRALVLKIAAGGLAGLAISAPAWVTFVDYLRISSVGIHLLVIGDHFDPGQAITLLLPAIFGPPFADLALAAWGQDGGYVGVALALLALLGLAQRRLPSLRWAMAAWIVFWLSVFFGAPVTHTIWAAVPALNLVQITRYAMPSLECAAVLLAALAVDEWCRSHAVARLSLAAAGFVALVAWTLLLAGQAGRLPRQWDALAIYVTIGLIEAALCAGSVVLLLRHPPSRRRAALLATIVLLDVTFPFVLPQFTGVRGAKLALGAVDFLRAHAGLQRVFALAEQLPTNYGSLFGIDTIEADSVPYAEAWDRAAVAIGGDVNLSANSWMVLTPPAQLASFRKNLNTLRQAAVRYVVVSASTDPFPAWPEPGMSLAYADAHTHIYALSAAAPYFDARGAPCAIDAESRATVTTECDAPATLLRRELLLPGWRAWIDGRKAPLHAGQGPIEQAFQIVAVPAGRASVTFAYAPPHSGLITGLSAGGLLALMAMTARSSSVRRGRRARTA